MKRQSNNNNRFIQKKRSTKKADVENRVYTIVSTGTIISGLFVCFASIPVGLSLILLGSMVLSEANVC